jgi:hypothetical protein
MAKTSSVPTSAAGHAQGSTSGVPGALSAERCWCARPWRAPARRSDARRWQLPVGARAKKTERDEHKNGRETNRRAGELVHAAAKVIWPGDAHDQDASTVKLTGALTEAQQEPEEEQ